MFASMIFALQSSLRLEHATVNHAPGANSICARELLEGDVYDQFAVRLGLDSPFEAQTFLPRPSSCNSCFEFTVVE